MVHDGDYVVKVRSFVDSTYKRPTRVLMSQDVMSNNRDQDGHSDARPPPLPHPPPPPAPSNRFMTSKLPFI